MIKCCQKKRLAFAAARQRGGLAVVSAFSLFALMGATGLAVDFSRAMEVRSQLANALDAAALAAGSSTGDVDALRDRFDRFLEANFDQSGFEPQVTQFDIENGIIRAAAEVDVPTTFMRALGQTEFHIEVSTLIIRETRGIEVAMVLDSTGSMTRDDAGDGQRRIEALRAAAAELTAILFGEEAEPELLRVAIVPYSAAVNVGDIAPSLISGSAPEPFDANDPEEWKGCVVERASPHDVEDTSLAVGGRWEAYFWESSIDNDWETAGINNNVNAGNNMRGPNIGCATPILPLTNNRDDVDEAIEDLDAFSRGGTIGHIGLAWGWRVLSPDAPFEEGAEADDPDWDKIIVMMTDGDNQSFRWNPVRDHADSDNDGSTTDEVTNPFNSDYSAFGRVDDGALGTTNRGTASNRMDDRLEDTCEYIKDEGAVVFTITFGSSVDNDTRDLYEECAGNGGTYQHAPDGSDLREAFREVGELISNLRVGS